MSSKTRARIAGIFTVLFVLLAVAAPSAAALLAGLFLTVAAGFGLGALFCIAFGD